MNIYTSYFAKLKKLPNTVMPISIARWQPHWAANVQCLIELAPDAELLRSMKLGEINEAQYVQRYRRDTLRKLNPHVIKETIEQMTSGKDAVLLCYEKSTDFCHRHIVAQWLKENLNIEVTELEV